MLKCFFEFWQESLVGSVVNLSCSTCATASSATSSTSTSTSSRGQGTTELMARFTNDMESLGAGMKMLFGKVVAEPLARRRLRRLACLISWQLTLMFLILVPIAALHPVPRSAGS